MSVFVKFAVFLAVVGSIIGDKVRADDFPGLGVSHMWANEVAFQNQFYNWAARGAWEVAVNTPDDQPLPFNAMTISKSLTEGSAAFEGYIHHSQDMSNRQLDAVERFDITAVQGLWPYSDSSGYQPPVMLPYGPEAYTPMYYDTTPSQNYFTPSNDAYDYGVFTPWGF